jgi:hypothetical protein
MGWAAGNAGECDHAMDGYAKVSFTKFVLGNFGASKGPAGVPPPLAIYPGGLDLPVGPAPTWRRLATWLVKPIRTTRRDWTEPVRLWRAVCMARRQDGVSAPEARAGRMATSVRMTRGQELTASEAESYHRSP